MAFWGPCCLLGSGVMILLRLDHGVWGAEQREGRGEGGNSLVNDHLTKVGSRTYSSDYFYVSVMLRFLFSFRRRSTGALESSVHRFTSTFPQRNNPTHLIQTICFNQGARRVCAPPPTTTPQTESYLSKQRMACLQTCSGLIWAWSSSNCCCTSGI